MAFRSTLLILVLAGSSWLHEASATERPGDAVLADALEQHASAVTALERDLLALIEMAPREERFDLYRTYNALIGAWVQVDRLQTLLDSVAAASDSDEAEIRAALRDHAQFALWQLDEAGADLERNRRRVERADALRIDGVVRSLLAQVRATISGYWLAVMPPST
jgi:hypothetical protein